MNDEWDDQAEHERDLRYESRQDYESWQKEEPESDPEREHMEQMLKHGLDWINDNASGTKSNGN